MEIGITISKLQNKINESDTYMGKTWINTDNWKAAHSSYATKN